MEKTRKEIRIRDLSPTKVETVKNIARYYGYSVGRFLKFEISKLIDSYPDHIKNFNQEQQ